MFSHTVIRLWLMVGLIAFAGSTPAGAQEAEKTKHPTITVYGFATVKAEPDSLRMRFDSQEVQPTLKQAREENVKQVKKLKEALAKLRVKGLKLSTTERSSEVTERNRAFERGRGAAEQPNDPTQPAVLTQFVPQTSFSLTIEEQDPTQISALAQKIMQVASENGAKFSYSSPRSPSSRGSSRFGRGGFDPTERGSRSSRGFSAPPLPTSSGVVLYRSSMSDTRKRALAEAVKDAMANARILSGGRNVRLISVSMVGDSSDPDNPGQIRRDLYEESATSVKAAVKVVCTYAP